MPLDHVYEHKCNTDDVHTHIAQGFLKRSLADGILAAATADDVTDALGCGRLPKYEAGIRDGWVAVGKGVGGACSVGEEGQ